MTEADTYQGMTASGASWLDAGTPWPQPGLAEDLAVSSVRARLFGVGTVVRVARYRVEQRLGAGGMGEVYLAYDDELSRRVAIKRVRPDRGSPALHERLRREARALAQLSHPNVVQVYEVGTHEGGTFIAMEYVEGRTLSEWCEQARSWRELLEVFLAAGRGLAAAHSAGVVHRDFKPDNVLIGDDGRVRVADFGLALAGEPDDLLGEVEASAARLTGTGGVAGTVRYMPLEQLRNAQVDARSDQFAFCVALYEALYGAEPFALDSVEQRAEALERDACRIPKTPYWRVPRGLWPLLRRGLRRDPDQRWPDLDALMRALERVPVVRTRRRFAAIAASLGLAGAWVLATPRPRACADIGHELAGIWDQPTRVRARELLSASHLLHAKDDLQRLEPALDDWARAWVAERRSQCEAAEAGLDTPELAWARRACLERQRRGVEVLGQELLRGAPDVLAHLVDALEELPDPKSCGARRVLEQPRLDSDMRDEVVGVRLELAKLRQLRLLGRAEPVRAGEAVEAARALDHLPLLAEATAELGKSQLSMGSLRLGLEQLEQAADLALRADHERLLADVWLSLALRWLTRERDDARGVHYWELADAQWSKLDPDPLIRARLSFGRGRVLAGKGELEAAKAAIEAAIRLLGDAPNSARPAYLQSLAELSTDAEAITQHRAALDAAEQAWGPHHPYTAAYLARLGFELLEHEPPDAEAATPLLERATNIWTAAHTQPHADLARAHSTLATLALQRWPEQQSDTEREQLLDRVEHHARLCATIQQQTLPPGDAAHGDAHNLLSNVAALRGDPRAAASHASAALEYWEREGQQLPHVLQLRYELGASLLGLGELATATLHFEQILQSGSTPQLRGLAYLGLAELELRRGRPAEALDRLEHPDAAQALQRRVIYELLLALAQLRVDCDGCRASARAHLQQAASDPELALYELGAWFEQLQLSEVEREAFAPLLEGER